MRRSWAAVTVVIVYGGWRVIEGVTTAGAFLILNFGGLPGLAQLGSLVAIGVTLAAVTMLNFFLPPLLSSLAPTFPRSTLQRSLTPNTSMIWIATALSLVGITAVLSHGLPALDHTANSLRPRHSAAYATLDEIKVRLGRPQEPYWLLVGGQDESEVAGRLVAAVRGLPCPVGAGRRLPLRADPGDADRNGRRDRPLRAPRHPRSRRRAPGGAGEGRLHRRVVVGAFQAGLLVLAHRIGATVIGTASEANHDYLRSFTRQQVCRRQTCNSRSDYADVCRNTAG